MSSAIAKEGETRHVIIYGHVMPPVLTDNHEIHRNPGAFCTGTITYPRGSRMFSSHSNGGLQLQEHQARQETLQDARDRLSR